MNHQTRIEKTFQEKYNKHICDKSLKRLKRVKDRMNKTDMVISFDLEFVILLSKADVSIFMISHI